MPTLASLRIRLATVRRSEQETRTLSGRIHLWLVAMDAPEKLDGLDGARAHALKVYCDRNLVALGMAWMQRLLARALCRWRAPLLLADETLAGDGAVRCDRWHRQARLVERAMGEGHSCRPVVMHRKSFVHDALADLRSGDRVVLIPTVPHRSPGEWGSGLRSARRMLDERRISHRTVWPYALHPGHVEAVAESLRATLADLPQNVPYEVLFVAPMYPAWWPVPGDDRAIVLQGLAQAVVTSVGLARPHHLAFVPRSGFVFAARPRASTTIKQMAARGVRTVVMVPLGVTQDAIETAAWLDGRLLEMAREAGISCILRAETVALRPTFVRGLVDLVTRVERDAGWIKPEKNEQQPDAVPTQGDGENHSEGEACSTA